ncbi:hypothetical protein ISN45_At03g036480 [Arabidopsis thaliana x Arabidopsis arenosa]|uniref:Uncharacterized protein n=1 Tax=Arabidopsis thaliana x Arabidopsis arenosa TaxID=1240361 RepID=A0A8T2EV01_9BRAS|nr:hypothetical protein ISN45_At03g036480 [Arabidopsis thaliana x Arabidopsis arenosa]
MSWSQIAPRDPSLTTWSQITSSRDPNSTTTEDEDGDGEIDHPISPSTLADVEFNGQLLQGGRVMAESTTPYSYKQLVNHTPILTVGFTTRKLDNIKDGHVVWDTGVKIIARVQAGTSLKKKGLRVTCSDLPVRFLLDPEGNMKGSLVGNRKRCEYLFNSSLDNSL